MNIDPNDIASLANEYLWRYGTKSKRIARTHILRKAYRQKRGYNTAHAPIHDVPEYALPVEPPSQYWHSLLNEILRIVSAMPYRQGQALLMNAQGFTVREIANALPAATCSVVIWIREARKALRTFAERIT